VWSKRYENGTGGCIRNQNVPPAEPLSGPRHKRFLAEFLSLQFSARQVRCCVCVCARAGTRRRRAVHLWTSGTIIAFGFSRSFKRQARRVHWYSSGIFDAFKYKLCHGLKRSRILFRFVFFSFNTVVAVSETKPLNTILSTVGDGVALKSVLKILELIVIKKKEKKSKTYKYKTVSTNIEFTMRFSYCRRVNARAMFKSQTYISLHACLYRLRIYTYIHTKQGRSILNSTQTNVFETQIVIYIFSCNLCVTFIARVWCNYNVEYSELLCTYHNRCSE